MSDDAGKQPKTSRLVRTAHVLVVVGAVAYFAGVLVWFSALFATGGVEEHAVMSVVIPVFAVVGLVAVVTMSVIVAEGSRADREKDAG